MNMYACLDESDDEKVVKTVAKKDDKKAPAAAPKKEAAAPAKAAAGNKPAAAAPKGKDSKGKENTSNKNTRPDSAKAPAAGGDAEEVVKKEHRSNDHRQGNHHHGDHHLPHEREKFGRKGGDPDHPTRKREFDRRSATGRSGAQRRGGRGPHALGNPEQEAQDAEKHPEAVEGAAEEGAEAVEEAPVVPAEPEDTRLTYDQYLAKRNEARAAAEAIAAVKLREVNAADYSGLNQVKEETIEYVGGMGSTKAAKVAKKSAKGKQVVVDLGFKSDMPVSGEINTDDFHRANRPDRTDRPERGDNSRGGRGGDRAGGRGGRGGEGRGAPRSTHGGKVDIFDASSFPSL